MYIGNIQVHIMDDWTDNTCSFQHFNQHNGRYVVPNMAFTTNSVLLMLVGWPPRQILP